MINVQNLSPQVITMLPHCSFELIVLTTDNGTVLLQSTLSPAVEGFLVVIIVYRAGPGTLCKATACVFTYFIPFAYEVLIEWYA